MESKTKITVLSVLFSVACFLFLPAPSAASPRITAVFVFGDSSVDSGNNNELNTISRSDHVPYGQDFPGHVPSGRFSNGKLTTDYLVSSLGLKDILPAYLDPSLADRDLLTGASFASGGSGFDELTSKWSRSLDLPKQVEYFEQALQRIQRAVGREEARRRVENALFIIAAGTNDWLYNFYLLPTRKLEYSMAGYSDFLLQNLERIVQRLYSMGARRFMVAGLPPIGCLPLQVTANIIVPSGHMFQRLCVDHQNADSQAYNNKLQALIFVMQASLPGTRVVYLDLYNPLMHMINNPAKYGFEEILEGCCGTGILEVGPLCNVLDPVCPDPSKYLFWDAVHLTQAAYSILAKICERNVLPQMVPAMAEKEMRVHVWVQSRPESCAGIFLFSIYIEKKNGNERYNDLLNYWAKYNQDGRCKSWNNFASV